MAVYQNVLSGEKREVDGDDVFWYEDNRANWARVEPAPDRFAAEPKVKAAVQEKDKSKKDKSKKDGPVLDEPLEEDEPAHSEEPE